MCCFCVGIGVFVRVGEAICQCECRVYIWLSTCRDSCLTGVKISGELGGLRLSRPSPDTHSLARSITHTSREKKKKHMYVRLVWMWLRVCAPTQQRMD